MSREIKATACDVVILFERWCVPGKGWTYLVSEAVAGWRIIEVTTG
jgi:hypothetical protein